MPKEVIKTRDGSSIAVGWSAREVQIGVDINKRFVFLSEMQSYLDADEADNYDSLWVSLNVEQITELQKNLARAKRYLVRSG